MARNEQQNRSAALPARMPKLSNKQLSDLLRVHEENLAALRDVTTKPPKFEQDLYDEMCKTMQQRYNVKLTPIGIRAQIWRLKDRVERKVNAAACKSGSTDEDVLLRTAGFAPVEAHLYKLLTDKVLPLVVKDQREHQREHHPTSSRSRASHAAADDSAQSSATNTPITAPEPTTPSSGGRSKANKSSPTKSETATPRKKPASKASTNNTEASAAQPAATTGGQATSTDTPQVPDGPPAKKRRTQKKKPGALAPPAQIDHEEIVATHSEPESNNNNNIDAYMDTIERVAQMGRAPASRYDEHLLDIRLPNLEEPTEKKKKSGSRKKKTAAEKNAEQQNENLQVNGNNPVDRDQYLLSLKLDPSALRIDNEDLLKLPTNGPADELHREKQLLCRTQRLLAAQRIALQTRQAEMLQSQTKFYDAWSGLASTFSSFFNFLPSPPPSIQHLIPSAANATAPPPNPSSVKRKNQRQQQRERQLQQKQQQQQQLQQVSV